MLLRTHTSPVQIRVMETEPPPIYSVMPGRIYRSETRRRHATLPVFHQIEGLVVDRGITFADLAGTHRGVHQARYFGEDFTSRLRPSYFPFTEPSAEFDISCVFCEGGCELRDRVARARRLRHGPPERAPRRAASTPRSGRGFAFGFGIDRLADDAPRRRRPARRSSTDDVRFLEQF